MNSKLLANSGYPKSFPPMPHAGVTGVVSGAIMYAQPIADTLRVPVAYESIRVQPAGVVIGPVISRPESTVSNRLLACAGVVALLEIGPVVASPVPSTACANGSLLD